MKNSYGVRHSYKIPTYIPTYLSGFLDKIFYHSKQLSFVLQHFITNQKM